MMVGAAACFVHCFPYRVIGYKCLLGGFSNYPCQAIGTNWLMLFFFSFYQKTFKFYRKKIKRVQSFVRFYAKTGENEMLKNL